MFRYKIDITIIATCFREPSAMNVRHYTRGLKIGVLHPRAEDICISHRKHYKVVSVLGTKERSRGTLAPYRYIFSSPLLLQSMLRWINDRTDSSSLLPRILTSANLSSSVVRISARGSSFRDWRDASGSTNEIILRVLQSIYIFFLTQINISRMGQIWNKGRLEKKSWWWRRD